MYGGGGAGMGPAPWMPRNDAERKAVEDTLRRMREGMGDRKGDRKETERKEIDRKEFKERKDRDDDDNAVSATKARVVVKLPADARLWVDQVECPLSGDVRAFDTPNLDPQQSYTYTLLVAVQRNGQIVQDSRRVQLTPGRQVEVDFNSVAAVRTASTE